MKSLITNSFKLGLCLVSILFITVSCSSEDDDANNLQSTTNVEVSINEYPNSGDLITTVTSSLSGNLTFSITSQSVSQAFDINSSSGEMRVLDWLMYDYETSTSFTATVQISNGTETENKLVIININNVDDIAAFLNSSRSAYDNASVGEWIMVTESEYNDLANYLAQVTKSGATDNHIQSNANIEPNSGNALLANRNGHTIPEASYLFAFKYYSWANNASNTKVKVSEGDEFGIYNTIGSTLPQHNDEYNHFVLKGNATATSNEGHLAIFSSLSIGFKYITGTVYGWGDGGDTDTLTNGNINAVFLYQGLSTTLKQWD
ncbi:cadherin repeat domain-containing protein [Psychroserpens sp.]|uniref:cadherin repeat domain-containing protein n=1 Tax=Psychroserpens sp. TaxID=2020870 RepID=UPI001B22F48E|nr:cadherin repeat domain-containing protein [Psychroserpens sp.]MBO6606899.1 cadherin repeat domain-containing protein [Psychroserpens sp.]MBO6631877.1 cadherin repeat domain-containing protein [Psychroserpens sp.]MBO6654045.1 cadherin repeat domain-containing protein [Psychroserpens sp.]MBO6682669.1 cadherin repeat domain-containing protein [Psychroserpens sp.]MBO6750671.1 cadherin repeat domain-containing protein [Psychroserpens sp.]